VYLFEGKYDLRTLERRFGPWSSLPEVFLNFAKDNPEWAEVFALLPVSALKHENGSDHYSASPTLQKKTRYVPLKDRATYGNPTHFRGLRHEPVNEQGVVLLFGMLAKELGYLVEAVQTEFPRLRGHAADHSRTMAARAHRILNLRAGISAITAILQTVAT
jgi:hypothetical protein